MVYSEPNKSYKQKKVSLKGSYRLRGVQPLPNLRPIVKESGDKNPEFSPIRPLPVPPIGSKSLSVKGQDYLFLPTKVIWTFLGKIGNYLAQKATEVFCKSLLPNNSLPLPLLSVMP